LKRSSEHPACLSAGLQTSPCPTVNHVFKSVIAFAGTSCGQAGRDANRIAKTANWRRRDGIFIKIMVGEMLRIGVPRHSAAPVFLCFRLSAPGLDMAAWQALAGPEIVGLLRVVLLSSITGQPKAASGDYTIIAKADAGLKPGIAIRRSFGACQEG
jgi:hypothetical protein